MLPLPVSKFRLPLFYIIFLALCAFPGLVVTSLQVEEIRHQRRDIAPTIIDICNNEAIVGKLNHGTGTYNSVNSTKTGDGNCRCTTTGGSKMTVMCKKTPSTKPPATAYCADAQKGCSFGPGSIETVSATLASDLRACDVGGPLHRHGEEIGFKPIKLGKFTLS
ncbi:hypothetical protein CROQUDRAFT_95059 [Cronartium quercuum f. sp. fusiforme G11]|uniref:Uncharacterized protein n=1 Tax=Cronartium quercuum f. sp. fusiforme G11 TaxID=708437 RepID=A0A9P6NJ17_9BASI|nr:hypothetical protein CROQUDRAFT_95059 [Cronartium quercuum f. sp. fusiforme G11]